MFRTSNPLAELDAKVLNVEGRPVAEREGGVGAFLRNESEQEGRFELELIWEGVEVVLC